MLISVHLPKTAGTSFGLILEKHFGSRILKDYSDFPINKTMETRKNEALLFSIKNRDKKYYEIDCIHGHFMPRKYYSLKSRNDTVFVTWFREPLSRMISHYNFWRRSYDEFSSPPLQKKVVEEGWSLEFFCFSSELKNFYNQFLWLFPLEYFDFIGIVENFDEDIKFFSKKYLNNSELDCLFVNKAPEKFDYETLDADFRKKFRAFHSEDYRLYDFLISRP